MTDTKPSKFLKIGLGASLVLNFLILGLVGGALINGSDARSAASGLRPDGMFALTAMLPRSDRDNLRDELREKGGHFDRKRAEHFAALITELHREDFSKDRFAALMMTSREARDVGARRAELALSERLAELTPKQRLEYADRLMRFADRGPKPRK